MFLFRFVSILPIYGSLKQKLRDNKKYGLIFCDVELTPLFVFSAVQSRLLLLCLILWDGLLDLYVPPPAEHNYMTVMKGENRQVKQLLITTIDNTNTLVWFPGMCYDSLQQQGMYRVRCEQQLVQRE